MIKDIFISKDNDGISVKIYRQGKIMGNHFSIFRTATGYKYREFNMDELIDKKINKTLKSLKFTTLEQGFNRVLSYLQKDISETLRREYDSIKKSA